MSPFALPRRRHCFFLFFLLTSCGYVGPIVPPSPEIPAAVKDLVAVERGNKIEVFFRTPPRTTDNLAIKKFSSIDLRIGPDVVPFDFAAWANGATAFPLPPPPPGDPLDPKPLPITGSLPIEGLLGKHVTVAVRTAVKAGDHYSSWSNRIVLDIVEPVKTPTDLKIAASANGIVLDWTAVDAADQYRILRQAAGETLTEIGKTDKPHFVDETSQFDIPYTSPPWPAPNPLRSPGSEVRKPTRLAISSTAPSMAVPSKSSPTWQFCRRSVTERSSTARLTAIKLPLSIRKRTRANGPLS